MGDCPGLSERVQLGSAACSLEVPSSAACSLEVAGFRVNFKDLGTQTSPTLVWVPRVVFRESGLGHPNEPHARLGATSRV